MKWNQYSSPVGVRVVVHEPGAVVVHVHGPRLVVLPQHHVLQDIGPGDAEGRVRVVVVAIHRHLPVVDASGEGGVSEDHPIVVAVARHRQVVVGEDDVWVGGGGVEGEPSNCTQTHTGLVWLSAGRQWHHRPQDLMMMMIYRWDGSREPRLYEVTRL